MMVKIETNTIINLRKNSEKQSIKIGLIEKDGVMKVVEFLYEINNGKVAAL